MASHCQSLAHVGRGSRFRGQTTLDFEPRRPTQEGTDKNKAADASSMANHLHDVGSDQHLEAKKRERPTPIRY